MIVRLIPKGHSLHNVITILGAQSFPSLAKSVRKAANTVLREWVNRVEKSPAKEGWKRRYKEAIRIEPSQDPLQASVSAEGMHVNFVENGIPRFDMKPGLLKGPKARVGESGQPYNIVMFRHGVPGSVRIPAMPKNVYQAIKESAGDNKSLNLRVIGIGQPLNTVQRQLNPKDKKGSISPLMERVHTKKPAQLAGENVPEKYQGMVRLGSPRHHQYATFRVVTKHSTGWIYPGVKKNPVFPQLEKDMKPIVKKQMQEGLMEDLKDGLDYLSKGKK